MGVKQEKKGKTVDKEQFLGKQPALPLRAQAWQTKKKGEKRVAGLFLHLFIVSLTNRH